uniref:Uncharacterized protein n=1 Tax=Cacopsylla melanoneura TaxID=428564 RepID=A0A8D9A3N5_9HEMI
MGLERWTVETLQICCRISPRNPKSSTRWRPRWRWQKCPPCISLVWAGVYFSLCSLYTCLEIWPSTVLRFPSPLLILSVTPSRPTSLLSTIKPCNVCTTMLLLVKPRTMCSLPCLCFCLVRLFSSMFTRRSICKC